MKVIPRSFGNPEDVKDAVKLVNRFTGRKSFLNIGLAQHFINKQGGSLDNRGRVTKLVLEPEDETIVVAYNQIEEEMFKLSLNRDGSLRIV